MIQGHAGRSVASSYRHFDLEKLAKGVTSIPVPGKKSSRQARAVSAMTGHEPVIGLGGMG
ncbi:MAG TPA: hypothetical protein VIF37_07280 [Methylobacter sp.]